jgi:predicted nucleic acid-binding protein
LKPILLDTGVIVALLDRSERRHDECRRAVDSIDAPLVTCEPVIAEACYLTRQLRGAPQAILQNVVAGTFQIPIQLSQCAGAVQRILGKYRDRDVDLADACLVHLASELRTGEILTLDGDFFIYRWGGNRPFRPILPLESLPSVRD